MHARCSQCHTFRGQGGKVGPDLTDIGRKGAPRSTATSPRRVRRSSPTIRRTPSRPRTDRSSSESSAAEGADAIRVTDTNAKSTVIRRDQIEQIRPSATSIMPVGLAATSGDAAIRDLIAFLCQQTVSPRRSSSFRASPCYFRSSSQRFTMRYLDEA